MHHRLFQCADGVCALQWLCMVFLLYWEEAVGLHEEFDDFGKLKEKKVVWFSCWVFLK